VLAATAALTLLNYRGLDIVGAVAMAICLLSLLPFLVFCVIGAFKVAPSRWLVAPPEGLRGVKWGLLLNTFFWNINFWESAASFAGEVEDPGRNYPLGMGLAVMLVFASLFLPVLIGTGASSAPYQNWTGLPYSCIVNAIYLMFTLLFIFYFAKMDISWNWSER
jgi:amino acid transporter